MPTESNGETSTTAAAQPERSWVTGQRIVAITAIIFLGLLVADWMELLSPANAYLARMSTIGAGLLILLGWLATYSPLTKPTRTRIALGSLATIGLLIAALRVEGVNGNIVPTLRFRWLPHADEALPRLSGEAGTDILVDLSRTTGQDFPQFLGPDRRATIKGTKLARDWSTHPPRLVWKQPIGAGWSAFSVVGPFAVTQEQRGAEELVTCYEVETGKLAWYHSTPVRFEATIAGVGPRATPTIHEGRVYTLGATGLLLCLDGATGKPLWQHDIVEETSAVVPTWGKSCSPLIWENLVIVSAGGPKGKSLVAYDKQSGELVWSAGDEPSSYASAALATFDGIEQIVMLNLSGVTAHNPRTGQILWKFPFPGEDPGNPSCSQPTQVGQRRLLLSKGYGMGCTLIEIERDAEGWTAKPVWKSRSLKTKFTNVVQRDGFAYALDEGVLECVDLDTGRRQWKQGRYDHGQVLMVDDLLLVQSETGELALVEATPESFNELARTPALTGTCWNTLCLTGKRLLIRSNEEAACYELP